MFESSIETFAPAHTRHIEFILLENAGYWWSGICWMKASNSVREDRRMKREEDRTEGDP